MGYNVFEDMGFDAESAQNLKLRTSLMIDLREHLKSRGLTQTQSAELLGIPQPEVSHLMRGKIDKFSLDKLVNLLAHVGLEVVATVRVKVAA